MTNFGPVNGLAVNTARREIPQSAFDQFVLDEKQESVFFADLTYRLNLPTENFAGGPMTVNTLPVNVTPKSNQFTAETVTMFFSSRNWIGKPDDTLRANQAPKRRLRPGFRIRRRWPYFPSQDRKLQTTTANIVLDNTRRDLDFLASNEVLIPGFTLPIRYGPLDGPYAASRKLAEPVVIGAETSGDDLIVTLANQSSTLKNIPLITDRFRGTGGLEGTPDLAGTLCPYVVGSVFNIPATLIDPNIWAYRINCRRCNGIGPVWDGALPLTFDADYPTYAALAAATIPAGRYATSLATGTFRLAEAPNKIVTCSVRGDATAGNYIQTAGPAVLRVLQDRAKKSSALLSISSYSTLSNGVIGWYNERKDYNCEDFISAMLRPENAVLGENRKGLLGIGKPRPPEAAVSTRTIRVRPTQFNGRVIDSDPIKKVTMRYGKNWNPFTSESDFNDAVAEIDREAFRREYLEISESSGEVAILAGLSTDLIKETYWAADAEPFVQEQAVTDILLYGRNRRQYEINDVGRDAFRIEDGAVITLVGERFGFDAGRKCVAIEFDESGDSGATIKVIA